MFISLSIRLSMTRARPRPATKAEPETTRDALDWLWIPAPSAPPVAG
jgi:hypothetical protein